MTTPVPFDPELQPAYDAATGGAPEPMRLERLAAVRAEDAAEIPSLEALSREGRFVVSTQLVPGLTNGVEVPLLICTPASASQGRAAIFHTHGGGMFTGEHEVVPSFLFDEAEHFGLTVISVGYRRAPEHPHPAPIDDVYAGLLWVASHADDLGIAADRIVAAGTSAGGGLTAALALRVRDQGGPRLLGQLLMCPMLDDHNDSGSALQMDGVDIWDRSWNGFGWDALLGTERGADTVSPYAAPARASDLAGLPPAFIDVGSAETLRDECVAYAARIWQAGGSADLHVWAGGFHVFTEIEPEARVSVAAQLARHGWLERVLA